MPESASRPVSRPLSQPPLPTPQSPPSPWIKLCGWNRPEVLSEVVAAGVWPDAVGLNFYKPSPRYLSPDGARDAIRRLPAAIEAVGLFVDTPPAEIASMATALGLRMLQLHGDYTVDDLTALRSFQLIRVYRLAGNDLAPVAEDLRACEGAGVRPWRCLVEPKIDGAYGGMGEVGPWDVLRSWNASWPPLILAGGLTPENVADAIRTVRPWGVDTASGVEVRRGEKDPARARAFIETARSAL